MVVVRQLYLERVLSCRDVLVGDARLGGRGVFAIDAELHRKLSVRSGVLRLVELPVVERKMQVAGAIFLPLADVLGIDPEALESYLGGELAANRRAILRAAEGSTAAAAFDVDRNR